MNHASTHDIIFLKHKYDEKLCSMINIDETEEFIEEMIIETTLFSGTLCPKGPSGVERRIYPKEMTDYINEQNKTSKKKFSENSIKRFIRSLEKEKSMYDDYICPEIPVIKTVTSINIEI